LVPSRFPTTPDAKEGDAYVIITTSMTNGTNAKVDLTITAVVTYDAKAIQAA
jgi:hypothetical protein